MRLTNRSGRLRLSRCERAQVYLKTSGCCAYCGTPINFKVMQVDHVQPLSLGGLDIFDNMLPACASCNWYKSTLTLDKFRSAVERFPVVLARDSATYRNAVRFGVVEPRPRKVTFYFEQLGIKIKEAKV